MLHCDLTVVGAGFEGGTQPMLVSSEIVNSRWKCFAKMTVGFIWHLMGRAFIVRRD